MRSFKKTRRFSNRFKKAYGLAEKTEAEKAEKDRVMEAALKDACSVPLEIMEKCCRAILLQKDFAEKGSALAISDAGVGVLFCKSALLGASLNVFINTKAMLNRAYAEEINARTRKMLNEYVPIADAVYLSVLERIV